MTNFTKENLIKDGEYVMYMPANAKTWADAKFVGRFKYGAKTSIGPFMTCLRKNITVEEYFERRTIGESPLDIAKSFGFVLSHIKKWLKDAGYPQTPEGYRMWKEAKRAA